VAEGLKAPSSNLQAPEKLQAPSFKHGGSARFLNLRLGISLMLGGWSLVLDSIQRAFAFAMPVCAG
jgi:hypothetical protein